MAARQNFPQGYLFDVLEVRRCFDACFLQAVSELLPSQVANVASRAYMRGDAESLVLRVIFEEAKAARKSLIAGDYDGDAYVYFFAAVERAAARALSLFERNNVLSFPPRRHETAPTRS